MIKYCCIEKANDNHFILSIYTDHLRKVCDGIDQVFIEIEKLFDDTSIPEEPEEPEEPKDKEQSHEPKS